MLGRFQEIVAIFLRGQMCNLLGDIFGDRLPVSEAENEDRDPGLSGRFLGQGRGQNIKQLMIYYKAKMLT